MSKRFKLVYEDNGMIKGSYTGIPSKKDEALIERTVLEGCKPVPVPPEPQPGPTPGPDTSLLPDFFVPFVSEYESIGVLELHQFLFLIGETGYEQGYDVLCPFLTTLKYKAKFPLSEETRGQLEDVIIYEVAATSDNSADIHYYPVNDSSKNYHTSVNIETDAETGDSWYIFEEVVKEEE